MIEKYEFTWANGKGYGYGKSPSDAVTHLKTRNKTIQTGELVQVFHRGINSYWSATKFHKALDNWSPK